MASVNSVAVSDWPPSYGVATPRSQRSAMARPLSLVRIIRDAALIIAILLLNKLGDVGAGIFFLILAAMVLHSPRSAMKALTLLTLGLMVNTAFVPKSLTWTPARLTLFPLALVRVTADLFGRRLRVFASLPYLAFMLYVLTMAFCSVASGWYTTVALLKLLNFWMLITTIFAGTAVLRADRADLTEWMVSIIVAAALLGWLAIALGVGQMTSFLNVQTTGGFIGAFLHPNVHSLFASLFVVFLASMATLGDYARRWLAAPLISTWFVFMAWSAARTSFVATTVGLLTLLFFLAPYRNRFGNRLRVNISRWALVGLVAAGGVALMLYDLGTDRSLSQAVVVFINKKGSDAEELNVDAAISSRLPLIEFSWNNFLESPLYGIGFQVGKTDYFIRNATLFSAPVEKGFLPTAVLEEGGVLGATSFVIFLLALLGSLYSQKNIPALVCFITFLASNFGEVSIFSIGGAGAFGWSMLGIAMILGDHCWREPVSARACR